MRIYTPKATKQSEEHVREEYLMQTHGKKLEGAIIVDIMCYYAPPKSCSKSQKKLMESGSIQRTVKPDVDNLAKTVLDALKGVAWDDDKQIVRLCVGKGYAEMDCAVITVEEYK